MSRSLLRPCLGCGKSVRGKTRCGDCKRTRDQARDQARRTRRPDLNRNAEIQRRRRAVAEHRATIGDWCLGVPGLRPAHPAANLSADHVIEVAAGGPESGPLVVRCGPCNNAKAARVLSRALAHDPRPGEVDIRLPADPAGGPVVA